MSESSRAVWLITGAAGALGQALVRRVLAAGHDCIALDRNERGLNTLHDELEQAGQGVPALMPMDLAGAAPEEYQRLADTIAERFGHIDVLVHNAASFQALRPLLHQQPGEWLEIIQTSLTAPYMLSAVLAPLMPGDGQGRVVMINDRHCLEKPGNWGAYGVAQAGREQMARSFAAEGVPGAPRVLAIDPGPFYSPLRVAAWPSDSPENLPSADEAAARIMDAIEQASQEES
jgi:NAD(P)-dependent dehydrogenase (short-subunit alcohol dehydrogenase family)